MVGVPGKSKGCSTCRRRKKGCDQKRPTCGQCLSSGYVCGGYQRELSFIMHPASKSAEKAFFVRHSGHHPALAFIPSLNRNSVDMQCRAVFWDIYLPRGIAEAPNEMLNRCDSPPNWTSILSELSQAEPALDQAFSALSIARVGRANDDLRLVKESTKLYGRALKDLQKALYDQSRMHTVEVLAACSVLGLYEMFEGGESMNGSVGWISHAAGAARLIELRGPDEHVHRQSHHLFLGARLPILYSAILRRKATFLANSEWLTIPWQAVPGKTYHDVLVDLAVNVPRILDEFDRLQSASSPETHVALQTLLQSCQDLKNALIDWEHKKSQTSRPVLVAHRHRQGDLYPFPREMSWDNHLFFNATLVYWAMQLVVCVTTSQIELLLAALGFPRSSLYASTTSTQQHARQFATCIAQSVPYAMMPDMGALGIAHLAFPLGLAFQHFTQSGDERICAWLIEVCNDFRCQGVRIQPVTGSLKIDSTCDRILLNDPSSRVTDDAATGIAHSESGGESAHLQKSLLVSSSLSDISFKSTFIYENPAKYYIDSPGSE